MCRLYTNAAAYAIFFAVSPESANRQYANWPANVADHPDNLQKPVIAENMSEVVQPRFRYPRP
jgi:hypothetical protein